MFWASVFTRWILSWLTYRSNIVGFKYDKDKVVKEFGHNFPPILVSNSEDQIIEHLIRMFDNRDHLTEIGLESQNWFNEVNGLNAGRKIIKLLKGCPVIK